MNFKELLALGQSDGVLFTKKELEEFVALVSAHEREECAKLCDTLDSTSDYYGLRVELACADAIRARGKA